MHLKLHIPTEVVVDEPVAKIVAEGVNGFFCLLPRHIDFASALVPGILFYTRASGEERFVAIDDAILVKLGPDVLVSALGAVAGDDLAGLKATVVETYRSLDEEERRARAALARLEAAAMRGLLQAEKPRHA